MHASVAFSADPPVTSIGRLHDMESMGGSEAPWSIYDPLSSSVRHEWPASSICDAGLQMSSRLFVFEGEGSLSDPGVSEMLERIFKTPVGSMDETSFSNVQLHQSKTDHSLVVTQSWEDHLQKLKTWMSLLTYWDGEGGAPLSSEVMFETTAFIRAAERAGAPTARVYIEGDGEVGYIWDTPRGFASISFLPEGRMVGKVRGGERKTLRIDEPFGSGADQAAFLQRIIEIA